MVGLSLRTLQHFLTTQQIPSRKIGRRRLIEVKALEAFLSEDRHSACAHTSSVKTKRG
jgi:Helix-turn-helix domain